MSNALRFVNMGLVGHVWQFRLVSVEHNLDNLGLVLYNSGEELTVQDHASTTQGVTLRLVPVLES